MTATFFASSRAIVYDCRRRHSRRPEACCWWRRRSRWIWSQEEDCVSVKNPFDIELRFKIRAIRKVSVNHRPSFLNFFSTRNSNIKWLLQNKISSWSLFLQFFVNEDYFRTSIIAWRHASDMTSSKTSSSKIHR